MARLVSVNVGLPGDIEWKGRTVHTGIWKDPVRGRCRVGRLNLDGDGQGAIHVLVGCGHGSGNFLPIGQLPFNWALLLSKLVNAQCGRSCGLLGSNKCVLAARMPRTSGLKIH
jgi:hypothetical protein